MSASNLNSIISSAPPDRHILVICIPAFGHIVPMLELARKLTAFHRVTFALSSSKVSQLKQRELITENDTIQLHPIHDGVTTDFDRLVIAHDHAGKTDFFRLVFASFVDLLHKMPVTYGDEPDNETMIFRNGPVDVVIIVNFAGAQAAICHERGVPFYLFNPENAILLQNILAISEETPAAEDENEADIFWRLQGPGVEPLPVSKFLKEMFLPLKKTMHLAAGVIINSCRALDVDALEVVAKCEEMAGVGVFCVGPLLPDQKQTKVASLAHLEVENMVETWLDGKEPASVVYVSFGSLAVPTPDQVLF